MQNVVVFESGAWGITYIRLSFVYSSRRSELIHEVFLDIHNVFSTQLVPLGDFDSTYGFGISCRLQACTYGNFSWNVP